MSVVNTSFSSVGERALSSLLNLVTTTNIFHQLLFQYKQLQIFLPITTSVKIVKNDIEFRKIRT